LASKSQIEKILAAVKITPELRIACPSIRIPDRWWTTFGEALLKGSSDGMRSSQRCRKAFLAMKNRALTSKALSRGLCADFSAAPRLLWPPLLPWICCRLSLDLAAGVGFSTVRLRPDSSASLSGRSIL